jgi:hypothetical protein
MLRQLFVACFAAVGRTGVHIRCCEGQLVAGSHEVVGPQIGWGWRVAPPYSAPLISIHVPQRWWKRVAIVQIMNRKREGRARILITSAGTNQTFDLPASPIRRTRERMLP